MPAKKEAPKMMDVAKPGKTAPTPTSRPVIIGHKPIIKDPMVNEDKSSSGSSEGEKITVTRGTKLVVPLSAPEVETPEAKPKDDGRGAVVEETTVDESKKVDTPAATPEPAKDEKPEEPAAEEEPAEATADEPAEETAEKPADDNASSTESSEDAAAKSEDAAVVDAVAEQAGNKKKKAEPTEEDKKKNEDLEKLIADKKYFVPVGQVTKKRRNRWALVWLLLVIVLAALYALDAELIDTTIKAPTDFIKV